MHFLSESVIDLFLYNEQFSRFGLLTEAHNDLVKDVSWTDRPNNHQEKRKVVYVTLLVFHHEYIKCATFICDLHAPNPFQIVPQSRQFWNMTLLRCILVIKLRKIQVVDICVSSFGHPPVLILLNFDYSWLVTVADFEPILQFQIMLPTLLIRSLRAYPLTAAICIRVDSSNASCYHIGSISSHSWKL